MALARGVLGCSSSSTLEDGGFDAGFDGGFDVGVDVGVDAGRDAGRDAGHDVGPDAYGDDVPPPDRDGDGVPYDEDAFPDDPSEWTDADLDGVGANADCDDDDRAVWMLLPGYVDADADGYGTGESMDVCSSDALPDGYTAKRMAQSHSGSGRRGS